MRFVERASAAAFILALATSLGCWGASSGETPTRPRAGEEKTTTAVAPAVLPEASIAKIETFCSDCHKLPRPDSFPQHRWPEEVQRGFDFYRDSKRNDLSHPDFTETVAFFERRAPKELLAPIQKSAAESPVRWSLETEVPSPGEHLAAISQTLGMANGSALLTTDMQSGEVSLWRIHEGWKREKLGVAINAARALPIDWDGDGGQDWLVAELGSFMPTDKRQGGVQLWRDIDGALKPRTLATAMGRVCEVTRIDWDADGDLDIVAAEFGWKQTGSLALLKNPGPANDVGEWPRETIDRRHGAVGVRTVDLDRDGLEDLVVAYAQEHESLEVLRQVERGRFEPHVLARLEDPSYGTSWFEVVDMDADGDLDLLMANGDSLDSPLVKPFHGLRWLRNDGKMRFVEEQIGLLPGIHQVVPADFDGDGDLDVAAVGLITGAENMDASLIDSIVWFERRPGEPWARHLIERGDSCHIAATAIDVDGDKRLDLIVGSFKFVGDKQPALKVYRNLPAEPTATEQAAK